MKTQMFARAAVVLTASLLSTTALAQTSASPFTSAIRYDAERRVVGTIAPDPDGTGPLHYLAVRNTYDAAGRLTSVEQGELSAWQSESIAPSAWTGFTVRNRVDTAYDADRRKLSETASAGSTAYTRTQWSWDANNNPVCQAVRMNAAANFASAPSDACQLGSPSTNGDDRITHNVYDAGGRLLKVQRAYGTSLQQDYVTYAYTTNGQRSAVIDANGAVARYAYDGLDRLQRWYLPDKVIVGAPSNTDYEEYGYDANGNRTSFRKRDGRTLTYSFDALNRMTQKVVPDGSGLPASATRDVVYAYDLQGHQTYARFDNSSGEGISLAYDGMGRRTGETSTMGGVTRTFTSAFDGDGNRTSLAYPDATAFTFQYDGLDRFTRMLEGTLQRDRFIYDAGGRRSGRLEGDVFYTYDAIDRLASTGIAVGRSFDWTHGFGYNAASQIVSRSRSNDGYRFTGYAAASSSYTANGLNQYTTVGGATLGYDANGNLTSDGTTTFTYDVENRLIASSAGASLTYDPLGRLASLAMGGSDTRFVHDGDRLSAEYSGAGTLLRRYLHGPGPDESLMWYEGSTLTQPRWLVGDQQGSVLLTLNSSYNAVALNGYDDYGVPNAANLGRFGYTGQAWLPELGLYYYKARMYAPGLSRFFQTDPIGYDDQVNLYAYVANDPVNKTDPTGLEGDDGWGSRVGQAVWGLGEVVVGGVGAGLGIAITTGSVAVEIPTLGTSTVGVAGGVILTAGSTALAADGSRRFGNAVLGRPNGPTISESRGNRGNRGGQGQGERGETQSPDKPGKHTRPDPNNPGNTIVNRPGAKPYSRPAREGEQGYRDRSAPPVPTIPRGKKKDEQ